MLTDVHAYVPIPSLSTSEPSHHTSTLHSQPLHPHTCICTITSPHRNSPLPHCQRCSPPHLHSPPPHPHTCTITAVHLHSHPHTCTITLIHLYSPPPTPSLSSSHTHHHTSTPPLSTTSTSSQVSPNGINEYKPTLDDRTYKVLTLSNSLRVLLISDPNSNVSAASMEVAAGSFSDPHNAEGLAHFCEHMLFLGTEKYPNQHEYSQFLTSHGGYDNAFTSTQETNYYFSVDSAYLKHTLDLFAQFFIAPLFEESSVEGEVHAVNAEHEKNLQSDGWKLWQLLKHVSNPQHPFHMFSTGSLSTLNNTATPLLPLLMTYYDSNYSANTVSCDIHYDDIYIANLIGAICMYTCTCVHVSVLLMHCTTHVQSSCRPIASALQCFTQSSCLLSQKSTVLHHSPSLQLHHCEDCDPCTTLCSNCTHT